MKYFFSGFVVVLLASCSASNLVRRADKLIARAEAKGAKWHTDTTFHTINLHVPGIEFKTTLAAPNWADTILIGSKGKDSIQVKILRIPATPKEPEKVFVQVACPDQVAAARVPVVVNRKIDAGYSLWDMIILAIVCLIVGYFSRILIKTIQAKRA